MTSAQATTSDVQSSRLLGQVKWFNNKAGYGFITVSDGEQAGKDIFVHYSSIKVVNSQYKYLIQGEYVEFTLTKSTGEQHEFQASDISGIKGGLLMCETRRVNRSTDVAPRESAPRKYRTPRDNAPRPSKSTGGEQEGFTQVRRRRQPKDVPVKTTA
uniref:CSD domain-containing protein n=1 Tax=viral metagenome TaxID=1070528 RepID=A0A6C0DAX1_9ZZZZ